VSLVNLVGIDQKERGKNSISLIYRLSVRVIEEFTLYPALFAPIIPAILNPSPCFIININKILIIKVNFREIEFNHQYSLKYKIMYSYKYTTKQVILP